MTNKFKSFVENIISTAKEKITELAKSELGNTEKKALLDSTIINYIQTNASLFTPSGVISKFCYNWVINKCIIPYVDDFTQIIYNLLKSKIAGVTENDA